MDMLKKIKRRYQAILLSLVIAISLLLTSCEVIGGIFKAGVWTGVIVVALIVALLIYLFSRFRRKE